MFGKPGLEINTLDSQIEIPKNLEAFLYALLDKHKEKIEEIVGDIRQNFMNKVSALDNKFFISFFVCDTISSYFSDLICKDFMKIEYTKVNDESLN